MCVSTKNLILRLTLTHANRFRCEAFSIWHCFLLLFLFTFCCWRCYCFVSCGLKLAVSLLPALHSFVQKEYRASERESVYRMKIRTFTRFRLLLLCYELFCPLSAVREKDMPEKKKSSDNNNNNVTQSPIKLNGIETRTFKRTKWINNFRMDRTEKLALKNVTFTQYKYFPQKFVGVLTKMKWKSARSAFGNKCTQRQQLCHFVVWQWYWSDFSLHVFFVSRQRATKASTINI